MRYDDDPRVAECQREIQRLRSVVRELQEECNRYKTIAYNAIEEGQIVERLHHNDVLTELGITEEEYYMIMEGKIYG